MLLDRGHGLKLVARRTISLGHHTFYFFHDRTSLNKVHVAAIGWLGTISSPIVNYKLSRRNSAVDTDEYSSATILNRKYDRHTVNQLQL